METSVEQRIQLTDKLYETVATHLAGVVLDNSPRSQLVNTMSKIALEHGLSIRVLVSLEQFASATALLRVQFEAVVRALWLQFSAPPVSIEKYDRLISSAALTEPADTPKVPDMLNAIDKSAPPQIGKMLRDLKNGAWGPMNSYVHGGIHPVIRSFVGYPVEYALGTLRNANGLSMMAAMLIAMLSGDQHVSTGMRQIQLDHLDCLPPLTP